VLYRDPIMAAGLTFLSVVEDRNVRQPVEEGVPLKGGTIVKLPEFTVF
jgi:hypothetical protein